MCVGGGKIGILYFPETKEELKEAVDNIQQSGKPVFVFGHTSNCYFEPNFSMEVAISTRCLMQYEIQAYKVVCQPGVHVRKIARKLTDAGIKGYSGLIDLPGTIAAAVFGNSGCYGCEAKDIVESIEIMRPDGSIQNLSNSELGFCRRSSALKRKEVLGVILSVTLKMEYGNKEELIMHAEKCHNDRKINQPGPANNLGSSFMSGTKTLRLRIIEKLARKLGIIFRLNSHQQFKILLILLGKKKLIPYLFNLNRFMWIDENSHDMFKEYVSFYHKIYNNAKLEIQIFK